MVIVFFLVILMLFAIPLLHPVVETFPDNQSGAFTFKSQSGYGFLKVA
ncbi:MAG: hypothetical protein HZB18_13865 [Chloroflexi bacterium]|nr:hypothetical protein [Chloroflexota bacterium]